MRVNCTSLSHDYGKTHALRDVSFELRPGVTGLVGVNGAGKSTLLRIVSGGLRPSMGNVTVLGADLYGSGRRSVLGSIALMPQELRVPREMRAVDVVAYVGWLRGLSSRAAMSRAADVLHAVGLDDRATSRVSALSGGMVRRLALAQALVAEPQVLLLDEPTTGLDPEQRAAVRALVADLPEDSTVLVSSHVMEDLQTLADDLLVLDCGEIVYHGDVPGLLVQQGADSAEESFLKLLMHRRAS